MKKETTSGKKRSNTNKTEGIMNDLAKKYGIKNYDPTAKFEEQFSFVGNPVISNLSGEYVAFEDISDGKYRIKLWHIRSGAVFEVLAGLALNAPIPSNPNVPNVPNVPNTPSKPKSKR
jgi:hypothetical protein